MRNRFRHGARFIADARQHCTPLDRNERARILCLAESLERATKPAGGRNGVLGYIGLTVLRTLILGFQRVSDGLCCPSVAAIQEKTGLSRSAIFEALNRLEAAGLICRVRRLVRRIISFGGLARLSTVQTSNLSAACLQHAVGGWKEFSALGSFAGRFLYAASSTLMLRQPLSRVTRPRFDNF